MDELNDIVASIQKLNRKIRDLKVQREAREKSTKERFNVFTALLNESDEVRLHSRFLHYLLNPHSNHDCGRLFLDLFLDTINGVVDVKGKPFGAKTFIEEKFERGQTEYFFIDLYFKFSTHELAIENKIYAEEQPEQIKGYTDKLGKNGTVLFLTLDGRESVTAKGTTYIRISYKEHILPWLEECLKNSYQYININQAIQQYRKVVDFLLNPNRLEQAEMIDVQEMLKKNSLVFEHIDEIHKNVHALRNRLAEGFMEALKEKLKAVLRLGIELEDWKTSYKDFSAFVVKSCDQNAAKVDFAVERCISGNELYIGIPTHRDESPAIDTNFCSKMCKKSAGKFGTSYMESEKYSWNAGKIRLLTDFITPAKMSEYIDEEEFLSKVNKVVEDINEYIDFVQTKYSEYINRNHDDVRE